MNLALILFYWWTAVVAFACIGGPIAALLSLGRGEPLAAVMFLALTVPAWIVAYSMVRDWSHMRSQLSD